MLTIHAQAIAEFGGLHGVRDAGALEAAIRAVETRAYYERASLSVCAAMYAYHLTQAHASLDGNKRISAAVAEIFLELNAAKKARGAMKSPFVKVGVAGVILRGNRIVLVRRKYGANKGKWCIPCGNVEVGEDVRDAVRREIKEETGLDVEVGDVVDALSTHHTPERSVVGVWFLATEKGGDLVAGDDASEVRLFSLDGPPSEMAFEADYKIIGRLKGMCL